MLVKAANLEYGRLSCDEVRPSTEHRPGSVAPPCDKPEEWDLLLISRVSCSEGQISKELRELYGGYFLIPRQPLVGVEYGDVISVGEREGEVYCARLEALPRTSVTRT